MRDASDDTIRTFFGYVAFRNAALHVNQDRTLPAEHMRLRVETEQK